MARFVPNVSLWTIWLCILLSGSLVMWMVSYSVALQKGIVSDRRYVLNEEIPKNKNQLGIIVDEVTFVTNLTYLRTVQNAPLTASKEKNADIYSKTSSRLSSTHCCPVNKKVNSTSVNIRNVVADHLPGIKANISEVNPHPFKYLHIPKPCTFPSGKSNRNLLILVKSAAGNKDLREGIRETWGKMKYPTVKIVYLLGYAKTSQNENESLIHRDIIQEDFIDAYQNNTYKTIMGFNWGIINCSAAQFLFFVDDDHMVNLPNLLNYINEFTMYNNSLANKRLTKLFAGGLLSRSRPNTNTASKWYIPKSEYPDNYWPPYLAGGAYLVSRYVALRFHLAFPHVKFIRIDDAYLGIVAKRLGISPIRETRFQNTRDGLMFLQKTDFFAAHGFKNAKDMMKFWKTFFKH